jgi:hypothetical protein
MRIKIGYIANFRWLVSPDLVAEKVALGADKF